jgi:outer membrane protein assembly factor BamA
VPEIDVRDAGITATATYDSRDRASFAQQGLAAELRFMQVDESMGADRNWSRVEAGFRKAVPFGRNTIWLSLAGGTDLGSDRLPGDRAFSLGGPRTIPAYQLDELRARGYWLGNASFLWSLVDLVPVRNLTIYGGLGLQALHS